MEKQNNNKIQYIFLYKNESDEVITTLNGKIFIINSNRIHNHILLISHISLYNIGVELFLKYNFHHFIMLPDLLKKYHPLLKKEGKMHIIFIMDNIIILSNDRTCTIYSGIHREQIDKKINGLVLGLDILHTKCNTPILFRIISICRIYNRKVFILNIFLMIVYLYIYINIIQT